jgi:hypothetical protein
MRRTEELDVPLLRKAVEWVQVEAAKPASEREWHQGLWRAFGWEVGVTCGTTYCVAGYIAEVLGTKWDDTDGERVQAACEDVNGRSASDIARQALGLDIDEAARLFYYTNDAKDVLERAREICLNHGTELGL